LARQEGRLMRSDYLRRKRCYLKCYETEERERDRIERERERERG